MVSVLHRFSQGVGATGLWISLACNTAWAQEIPITDIRIETTAAGVQIQLETSDGVLPPPSSSTSGESTILEISGVDLQVGDGSIVETDPAEGISSISVTAAEDTVQIQIIGILSPPQVSVSPTAAGLTLIVTEGEPAAQASDLAPETGDDIFVLPEIEVVGEREVYRGVNSGSVTRFQTDILDSPQTVQVVPRQVLEDQGVVDLPSAVRNVSGVFVANTSAGTTDNFNIRGFESNNILRDGFRDGIFTERSAPQEVANLEQVEVLKGPASVLLGQVEPAGVINLVTEQPLATPQYTIDPKIGGFGFTQPSIDFTGPLTESGNVRYRLNALRLRSQSFRQLTEITRDFVAPSIAWDLGDNTTLTLDGEYLFDSRPFDRGVVAFGTGIADIPFSRRLDEPLFSRSEITEFRLRYGLEHEFSPNWSLSNGLRFFSTDRSRFNVNPNFLDEETGNLTRTFFQSDPEDIEVYTARNDVVGNFSTGFIDHEVLLGVEFSRQSRTIQTRVAAAPSINIFDPVYLTEADLPDRLDDTNSVPVNDNIAQVETFGLYFQDRLTFSEQLTLQLGARQDWSTSINNDGRSNETSQETFTQFSPFVGLVYQPSDSTSYYASFSTSFAPNVFITNEGEFLEPEEGEQFEIGLRQELLDGSLLATLALYEITKQNVPTVDPINPAAQTAIGEQRSRGIEFDLRGELAPGWNIIASYTNIDAIVVEDNAIASGSRLINVPRNSGSIWTTYEFQEGSTLEGFGFGAGLFIVGDRRGDFDATYRLDAYEIIDAVLFYRNDNMRIALNFNNINDVRYIESAGSNRTNLSPGEPFTVLGSIDYTF